MCSPQSKTPAWEWAELILFWSIVSLICGAMANWWAGNGLLGVTRGLLPSVFAGAVGAAIGAAIGGRSSGLYTGTMGIVYYGMGGTMGIAGAWVGGDGDVPYPLVLVVSVVIAATYGAFHGAMLRMLRSVQAEH